MNNLQLLYQTGLPIILILVGIILNERNSARLREDVKDLRTEVRHEIKELRTEMKAEFKEIRKEAREGVALLNSRIDRVDADLAAFYRVTGIHEGRLDELSKR